MKIFKSYENMVLLVLGLVQGVLFFDRLAFNYLSPLVSKDLALSNFQVGMLSAIMSATWGLSGFFISALSDRTGQRKSLLIAGVLLFSACSTLSGLAGSFLSLLLIRCLMGVFEGPILPISQAIVADASTPARRGLNMGLLQNFAMFIIAQFLGPIILTRLGEALGWRSAFFITGAPSLLIAWLIWRYIRRDGDPTAMAAPPALPEPQRVGPLPAWAKRNLAICMLLACSLGGWMFLLMNFLPLYSTRMAHLSVSQMGIILSMVGAAGIVAAIAVPGISDRVGRKPALAVAALTAFAVPVLILTAEPTFPVLAAVTFISSFTTGCFPLYIAIVPAESMPHGSVATSIGAASAAAELVGGFLLPPIAGRAADLYGLRAPFAIMFGLAIVGFCLILMLSETAPAKRKRAPLASAAGVA
jgi:MFS family permease